MDSDVSAHIQRTLQDAETIHDVTLKHILSLQNMQVGRLALDKYVVTPEDFQKWYDKENLGDVEYDSGLKRVIIIPGSDLFWSARDNFVVNFSILASKLRKATGSERYKWLENAAYDLSGPWVDDRKQPAHVIARLDDGYPIVVLEIGFREDTEKLFARTRKWFEGSEGITCSVLILDLQAHHSKNEAPCNISGNDQTWGLPNGELLDFQDAFSHWQIFRHVRDWYTDNGCQFYESATAALYFCQKDLPPTRLWGCEVTVDKIRDEPSSENVTFTPQQLLGDAALEGKGISADDCSEITGDLKRLASELQEGLRQQQEEAVRLKIALRALALREEQASRTGVKLTEAQRLLGPTIRPG
ncbi:hypothetical protein FQN54_002534 [Arachnomyces sp. PD_36]|nr:hypothetical protein FQN54_002534 [Arachnomyces sp. PD_36]